MTFWAHVFRTLEAMDLNMQNQTGHSRTGVQGRATWRKTWQQWSFTSRILQQASEVDARDLKKTISYRQGLDSDSSTSIIPPEMGLPKSGGGSHKLDEDLGCDFDKGRRGDKVHVGTALWDHQACLWQQAMSTLWHRGTRFVTVSPSDGNLSTWSCSYLCKTTHAVDSRHKLRLRYFFLYCWKTFM